MNLVRKSRLLIIVMGWLVVLSAQAQTTELSAVMTVIGETVTLQRGGTEQIFPLSDGSIMPLGAGDMIVTGETGRALITFHDVNHLLLLPNTQYELNTFVSSEDNQFSIDAELHEGVLVQQFQDDPNDWIYQLSTETVNVELPSELFAVWAIEDYLEAAISAEGILTVNVDGESVEIPGAAGLFPPYSVNPISLEEPYHAAQLLALSIGCYGSVNTSGSAGLRLRRGAALDYGVVEILQDGQEIPVIGTTENGLWYGIPYQTGLGWLYSTLVDADCDTLPEFPNLVGNQNELIRRAQDFEIALLWPFYGLPETNSVFYQ